MALSPSLASPKNGNGESPGGAELAAIARGQASRDWLKGRQVSVVGLARSGVAASRLLVECGARVVATDETPLTSLGSEVRALAKLGVQVLAGGHPAEAFRGADLVVVSPGVPLDTPVIAHLRATTPVIGELELAWRVMEAETIAIAGTNGKTTTTALLGALLRQRARAALVGGDTDTPLAAHALGFPADGIVVAEVSSGQLETIQAFRPRVAAVLNVTPDHLDRHQSFAAYVRAEARIFENQRPVDCAVLNRDDEVARGLADCTAARVIWFSRGEPLAHGVFVRDGWIVARLNGHLEEICPLAEIALGGAHKVVNVLAATACALWTGMAPEAIRRGIGLFRGG